MSLRSLLPLLGLLLLIPSAAWGQATVLCNFVGDRTSSPGPDILILHSPFTATCDDGTELRADSGQVVQSTGEVQLVGNVYFNDAAQTLTAEEATYNRQTARLYARGNVNLVNRTDGTTLIGPELEYFRANEERPEALVFATQRPTLIMEPRDSAGNPRPDAEKLTLIADRVNIVGEDDLTAQGNVLITQEGLNATGEEARYDSTNETLELRQNASITREESTLSGEVVQAQLVEGSLQHVQSRTDARLDGEDLTVAAPDIQLFFDRDTLQQVVARVPPDVTGERARAASRTFRTEADSIDAVFIAGELNVVYAIGAARGETIDTMQVGADNLEMVTALEVPDSIAGAEPGAEPESAETPEPREDAVPPVALDPRGPQAPVVPPADNDDPTPAQGGETGTPEAPPSPESIAAVTASDWIRGDTIIALFAVQDSADAPGAGLDDVPPEELADVLAPDADDPVVAQADCVAEPCPAEPAEERDTPQLTKLIARREAQSFYRLASENSADPNCRNLSFLVGAEIELDVSEGELEVANVRGLEQGIYLEANNCTTSAPAGEPADDGIDPVDGQQPEPVATPPLLDTAMIRPWE